MTQEERLQLKKNLKALSTVPMTREEMSTLGYQLKRLTPEEFEAIKADVIRTLDRLILMAYKCYKQDPIRNFKSGQSLVEAIELRNSLGFDEISKAQNT